MNNKIGNIDAAGIEKNSGIPTKTDNSNVDLTTFTRKLNEAVAMYDENSDVDIHVFDLSVIYKSDIRIAVKGYESIRILESVIQDLDGVEFDLYNLRCWSEYLECLYKPNTQDLLFRCRTMTIPFFMALYNIGYELCVKELNSEFQTRLSKLNDRKNVIKELLEVEVKYD